jgi:hypothetical protein
MQLSQGFNFQQQLPREYTVAEWRRKQSEDEWLQVPESILWILAAQYFISYQFQLGRRVQEVSSQEIGRMILCLCILGLRSVWDAGGMSHLH